MQKIGKHISLVMLLVLGTMLLKFFFSSTLSSSTTGIKGYQSQPSVDILFVGSSLTRQSYDIRSLDSLTHQNTYLLAYNGLSPVFAHALLQNAWQNPALVPKVLVMEAYPYKSVVPTKLMDVRMINDGNYKLKMNLLHILHQQTTLSFVDYFYLLAQNNETLISYPFTGKYYENLSYKGAYQNKYVMGLSNDAYAAIQDPLAQEMGPNYPIALDKNACAAHQKIVALCNKKGVKCIYLVPPISQKVADMPSWKQAKNLMMPFLKDSIKPTLIIDNPAFQFDYSQPQHYNDGLHLSTAGRAAFSLELGKKLATEDF